MIGNDLVIGKRHRIHNFHHYHHRNHHVNGFLPFDFSLHKTDDLPIELHDFEQLTDEDAFPNSETYFDILEEELRQASLPPLHKIRHQPKHALEAFPPLVSEIHWPVKKEAEVDGDLLLGGLMMVHEREDSITCGPIMPQGGIQALEAMLYTLDRINQDQNLLPNISLGTHILDDCDKDTYGLEMAVDFIKGRFRFIADFMFYRIAKKFS